MKYNIVSNEGEPSSVTVFFGGGRSRVATKDHPNFGRILQTVRIPAALEASDAEKFLSGLFDVGQAISDQFTRLSERVLVNTGKVFFDGIEVDNSLTQAIVRFYTEGNDDFQALVNFMEKIETNPNQHSKEQLFRWLGKHNFAICPDGDFIAYKGVGTDSRSVHSGAALVNGKLMKGQIPNASDTVIEMPRDQVVWDPANGCSTGLHVANWSFAHSFAHSFFAGGKVVRVKVNPRDVVSVPTDSGDQKMRVCRYRVLDVVAAEDRTALYVGDAERTAKVVEPHKVTEPSKDDPTVVVKRKRPVVKVVKTPRYYEQFKTADFRALPFSELRWLAKEWGVKKLGSNPTKAVLVKVLASESRKRLRTWK